MKILNNKKSKTLPSNGTQSNSSCTSKLLFNKEKEQQLKKSLYLRFWVALVLTNIFTFILSQPMTEATIEKEINNYKKTFGLIDFTDMISKFLDQDPLKLPKFKVIFVVNFVFN